MQEDPPYLGQAQAPGRRAGTGPALQRYLTLITSPITGLGEASLGPRQLLGGAPPGSSAPLGLGGLGLSRAHSAICPPRAREAWSTHSNTQGLPDVPPPVRPGPPPLRGPAQVQQDHPGHQPMGSGAGCSFRTGAGLLQRNSTARSCPQY